MPFITSLGSAALFGFGFSKKITAGGGGGSPYTGTLYYYEAANESDTTSTWATLTKWYKNSEHTQQASALPTTSNATVLLNNTSANLEASWTAPASINIAGHTLELIAHTEGEGCAAAVVFSTTVTGTSVQDGGTLILNGHITIAA